MCLPRLLLRAQRLSVSRVRVESHHHLPTCRLWWILLSFRRHVHHPHGILRLGFSCWWWWANRSTSWSKIRACRYTRSHVAARRSFVPSAADASHRAASAAGSRLPCRWAAAGRATWWLAYWTAGDQSVPGRRCCPCTSRTGCCQ